MNLKINDTVFNVRILYDIDSQKIGMAQKTFDEYFNGLLFVMSHNKNSFWMKDCIIPLDIIFIDNNIISKIHHNCQPCHSNNCELYTGPGNLILEIAGESCERFGIKVQDFVELLN